MKDLYIIAAGKGSRMGGSLPKALVPLAGQPNLTTTLQQIGHKFSNVFIVTNEEMPNAWGEYFVGLHQNFNKLLTNVNNIPIKSGRGDGHAVFEALKQTSNWNPEEISDDIVVIWGDVFFPDERIIDELFAQEMRMGVVPTVREKAPYVGLRLAQDGAIRSADFSKYGEDTKNGYHDQSVFRFNRHMLLNSLDTLDAVLDKNGKYITPNGEMSLLYLFHFIFNMSNDSKVEIQAYETLYPTMSFNTVEEVAAIQQEIDEKWRDKFRK